MRTRWGSYPLPSNEIFVFLSYIHVIPFPSPTACHLYHSLLLSSRQKSLIHSHGLNNIPLQNKNLPYLHCEVQHAPLHYTQLPHPFDHIVQYPRMPRVCDIPQLNRHDTEPNSIPISIFLHTSPNLPAFPLPALPKLPQPSGFHTRPLVPVALRQYLASLGSLLLSPYTLAPEVGQPCHVVLGLDGFVPPSAVMAAP